MTTTVKLGTRAVLRRIEPGTDLRCAHCEQKVKFKATKKLMQVIANCYKRDKWDRVEHFHEQCYLDAGEPYGPTG